MGKAKYCPECGSKNIAPFMGFDTGMQYQCLKCGWIGVVVIEKAKAEKGR